MSKKSKSITVAGIFLSIALAIGLLLWSRSQMVSGYVGQCKINLKIIQESKVNWSRVNHMTPNDTPSWEELTSDLKDSFGQNGWTNNRPICPKGGTYTLGRVVENPQCSIGGPYHSLP